MAVESAFQALTGVSILLLIGLVVTTIAYKLKIASIFLLLLSGFLLSYLHTAGIIQFWFSEVFMVAIAIFTLAIVVFDGTSRFNIKRVRDLTLPALRIFSYYALFSTVIISLLGAMLFFSSFDFSSILLSAIFAISLTATDPSAVFEILKTSSNKLIQILELESILNTPFTVVLPLIVLQLLESWHFDSIRSIILGQITPLMLQITAGIGMGILVGFIDSNVFKKFYNKDFAPITLITSALLAFLVTEYIGGSGVLAVATMGLFYGSSSMIHNRDSTNDFNTVLTKIFILMVFVLVGFLITTPINIILLIQVCLLFMVAFVLRYFAITLTLPKDKFTMRERVFASLVMPKGVAVAVVVFTLAVLQVGVYTQPLQLIIQAIIYMMMLSLFVATIITHFADFFFKPKAVSTETNISENEEEIPIINSLFSYKKITIPKTPEAKTVVSFPKDKEPPKEVPFIPVEQLAEKKDESKTQSDANLKKSTMQSPSYISRINGVKINSKNKSENTILNIENKKSNIPLKKNKKNSIKKKSVTKKSVKTSTKKTTPKKKSTPSTIKKNNKRNTKK